MTRAAIYARFSTDLQNDRSVDDQVALCKAFAAQRGWTIAAVFADRAASGASVHGRPDYGRMLIGALEGQFDIILCEDLDRLSRNLADTARLYERAGFLGLKIWTVADGEITDMHVGLRGTMSAMFLKNLALKVRRGMAGVIRDGRHAGGRAYGYRPRPGRPGELEIVPDEAAVIRRIFERYLAGETPRAIAGVLNSEGVAPPRGIAWNASTINGNRARGHGILLNAIYTGRLVWNRVRMVKDPDTGKRVSRVNPEAEWQIVEAPDLQIIDDATFEAVAARKAKRAQSTRQENRSPRHLLSGLLRCGCCGAGMSVKDRDHGRVRIICSRAKESRSCTNGRSFYLDRIEAAVVGGIREQLVDQEGIRYYVKVYNEERQRLAADLINNRASLERALARAEGELQRTIDLAIKGIIGEQDAAARLPALRAERDRVAADLASAEQPPNIVSLHPTILTKYQEQVEALAATINAGSETGSAASKTALRDLIETVTIQPIAGTREVDVVVKGHLAALIGGNAFPTFTRSGDGMVAGEGLEPPTRGL